MIMVAEVKGIDATPFGHQMVLKHLSDMPLRLSDELNKSLRKRFEYQMAMRSQIEHSLLLMIGTFSQPMPGIFDLETCCLVNVNEAFLPFESVLENELLNALVERRFTKGLRFNLKASTPIATAILHDTATPDGSLSHPAGRRRRRRSRVRNARRQLSRHCGMDLELEGRVASAAASAGSRWPRCRSACRSCADGGGQRGRRHT